MRCSGRYNHIPYVYWSIIKNANSNWKMYYFFSRNSPGQKPWKVSPKPSVFFSDKCNLFSCGPLGDSWQNWELTQVQIRFCSTQRENLCFCFNSQESVLGPLVFFHFSEKIQKHMMLLLPKTVSLRNVNACGYCLSVDNMLLWIYIRLSSGRDLVEFLHIKSCTSLVFAQMYLFQSQLNIYSFSNNISFWTEMRIWQHVKKYFMFVTMLTVFTLS